MQPDRTRFLSKRTAAAVLVLAGVVACAAEKATPATPAPSTSNLIAHGKLTVTIDGKDQVLDYEGVLAEVTATHRINPDPKGYACFAKLDLALQKADGSCRLELSFMPSANGLRVASGQFYAVRGIMSGGSVVKTIGCGAWPGATTKEMVYKVLPDDGGIGLDPLSNGKGAAESVALTGLNLAMTGKVALQRLGTKVSVSLAPVALKGTLVSHGSPTASCGAAVHQTGAALCATTGTPGGSVGALMHRESTLYDCTTDTPVDLGELCGNEALWVIDWRDWTASSLLKQIGQVLGMFKDNQIGVAVVVVEGKEKVVVKTGSNPDKYEAIGPKPTAAECKAIAERDGVPAGVLMLVDKDAQLVLTGKTLTDKNTVPAMLFASTSGVITGILPKETTAPTNDEIKAQLDNAMTAP